MSTNPYAPPTAHVDDVDPARTELAPALWNPNAAANWSLLFSPVFGAWLHMKNWQALGDAQKASASRTWAIVTLVLLLLIIGVSIVLPESKALDGLSRTMNLVLLLVWYFGSGRAQTRYAKEHFGTTYPRKGWGKPLLIALGVLLALFVLVFLLAFGIGMAGG